MDGKLVDEAFSHLGLTTVSFLATCEDGQPHVRPMMLIRRGGRLGPRMLVPCDTDFEFLSITMSFLIIYFF